MTIETKKSCPQKKIKNNCLINCSRCGTCCICRRIIDFDLKFYKPAFHTCPYLEYSDNITRCTVYGTDKMPKQCQDESWTRIKDSCLSAYKHTEGMQHLLWAKKLGYLDRLRVINDINTEQYDSLSFVIQTFIVPYLKHIPKSLACSYDWLENWGVCEYINNIPKELEEVFFTQIRTTCERNYKKNKHIPLKILELLKSPIQPTTDWLKQLKFSMWS